jgi:hypothetical protein
LYIYSPAENEPAESSTTGPAACAGKRPQRANRGNRMAELLEREGELSDDPFDERPLPRNPKGKAGSNKRKAPASEEESGNNIGGPTRNPMAPPLKKNKRFYDPKVRLPS